MASPIEQAMQLLKNKGYTGEIKADGKAAIVSIDDTAEVRRIALSNVVNFVNDLPKKETKMSEKMSDLLSDIEEQVRTSGSMADALNDIPDNERPMDMDKVVALLEKAFNERLEVEVVYVDAKGIHTRRTIQLFSPLHTEKAVRDGDTKKIVTVDMKYLVVFDKGLYPDAVAKVKKETFNAYTKMYAYTKDRIAEMALSKCWRTFRPERIIDAKIVGNAEPIPFFTDSPTRGKVVIPVSEDAVDPTHYAILNGHSAERVLGKSVYPYLLSGRCPVNQPGMAYLEDTVQS